MNISKNKIFWFFLMSQGTLDPKSRFLGQKMCFVARVQTDTQTDKHESEYKGHPFRVSGIFPSTYHQGSFPVWPLKSTVVCNFGSAIFSLGFLDL